MTRAADPISPQTASATLVLETPVGAIEPRPLVLEELTIGRDARCGVQIEHPTVSRLHARLWRDGRGWHFQDLGSQNGSRVNNAFTTTPVTLTHGAELHIGRVRAWFFGASGVPDAWRPSVDEAEHAGRLMRCRCGHIGWVPDHTAGMMLTCARCGRDLAVRDRAQRSAPAASLAAPASVDAPRAVGECAACHSPIGNSDAITTCSECGAQMHADCWRENRGCATYGCTQVNALDTNESAPSNGEAEQTNSTPAVDEIESSGAILQPSRGIPLHAAQTLLVALLGLPTFGIPAIAYGVYRALVGSGEPDERRVKRIGYAVASFLAGAAGFVASAYWWLGGVG